MAYSSHSISVTANGNEYEFSASTEWENTAYNNTGYSVAEEPNSEGYYEIILNVEEDSQGTPSPVIHEFSLEDMGVTPNDDADILVIVKEGAVEHGRVYTSIAVASEEKRPIKNLSAAIEAANPPEEKRSRIKLPKPTEKTTGASEEKRPIKIPNNPPNTDKK